MLNPRVAALGEFPFRRLTALFAGVVPAPGRTALDLSIGEPKHAPPALLGAAVAANEGDWNCYPPSSGTPAFAAAVVAWLERRFALPEGMLPEGAVLPLAGTKEGLFMLASLAVAARDNGQAPAVLMPCPLYAVYYGAAVMAGAEPVPLPATAATGFLPDLDALPPDLLARTAVFYLCNPANPQGTVAPPAYLDHALSLAREHGFLLVLDECYSEIWDKDPPPGGLEAAARAGGLERLVVVNSLSKRSNAAGLRSGFIAGDPDVLRLFLKLRAYAAAVLPLPLIAAAAALWRDEAHVVANRARYRAKLDTAERLLAGRFGFYRPAGGFFLWLDVGDGVGATERLWREAALRVLPGAYLVPPGQTPDPGHAYIRLALVHDEPLIEDALERLVTTLG